MVEFDAAYRGARFFKCDLHMHSQASQQGWRGTPVANDSPDLADAARAYARRCLEVGLEVIAITDHGSVPVRFIEELRSAIGELSAEFPNGLVVFPGFEITARVGRGMHVLALFDPETPLTVVEHIITKCGLPPARIARAAPARTDKNLAQLLEIIQKPTNSEDPAGLVICPHAQGDAGIFDNQRISEAYQQDEFTNEELLCVEVPKPPAEMSDNFQRLFRSGPQCLAEWRRRRPIACLMSSDAKALDATESPSNYIGFRYSWIKMSSPSIEALRQAFLDSASRIRLTETRPEHLCSTPRIGHLSVQGAEFLADTQIHFSPHLNVIIGGRGTGKSTIVEYIRIGCDQVSGIRGSEPAKNLQTIGRTLTDDSELRLSIHKEDQSWSIVKTGNTAPHIESEDEILSIARFFPVQILSQKEIYEIAQDRQAQTRIIDDLAVDELAALRRREEDIQREAEEAISRIEKLGELRTREAELVTERENVKAKVDRLAHLREPIARWRGFKLEKEAVDRYRDHGTGLSDAVENMLEELPNSPVQEDGSTPTPNESQIARISDSAAVAQSELVSTIAAAIRAYHTAMDSLVGTEALAEWSAAYETEKEAYAATREELVGDGDGVDPDDLLTHEEDLRSKTADLEKARAEIASLAEIETALLGNGGGDLPPEDSIMGRLHGVWAEQSIVRSETATALTAEVPETQSGIPFVTVAVTRWGDRKAFLNETSNLLTDRRRISEDDWGSCMSAVFENAMASEQSPFECLAKWARELVAGVRPVGFPWSVDAKKTEALLEWLDDATIRRLRLERVPDGVTVRLYRDDGSEVGALGEATELSVGQRCTAVLAMLLARSDIPIVIDQPEEDLDNVFVYRELVPFLRSAKQARQIIVVSHNANIPVNADCELLVALDVQDGRGGAKSVGDKECVGALDRPAVNQAVTEIMEGSEEAFRRRSDKYGF